MPIDVQSFNGNIAINVTESDCRSIYAKTTTGSVELAIPDDLAVKAELKSNLGSLSHELMDVEMLKEKNDTIQKEMMFTSNQIYPSMTINNNALTKMLTAHFTMSFHIPF